MIDECKFSAPESDIRPSDRVRAAHKLRLYSHLHRNGTWEGSSLDIELMARTDGCTPSEVAGRLAGLIDPVCHPQFDGFNYACDRCQSVWLWYPKNISYCPYCGARILREEE